MSHFAESQRKTLESLALLSKTASGLKDIPLWSSTPQGTRLQAIGDRVLKLFQQCVPEPISQLNTVHDLSDSFHLVTELIDDYLEKTVSSLTHD